MKKISKQNMTDIQQEISDSYYERAAYINTKHSINKGLKASIRMSVILTVVSIVGCFLPVQGLSALLWLFTATAFGVGVGFAITKYNNFTEIKELTEKINDLEQLQKDMAVDYNLQAKNKIDVSILHKTTLKVREKDNKEKSDDHKHEQQI